MKNIARKAGFTLIELLVVIGILTILLALVLVAINPARQFAIANNAKRRADINTIINAISQYQVDNKGALPANITSSSATIANTGADICAALVTTYAAKLPIDPLVGTYTDCTTYNTGYTVFKSSANNRVTVSAPNAEIGDSISVTR